MASPKTMRLDPSQVTSIASPARLEILQAMAAGGPCSAADVARRLRRSKGSVYHHVHALEKAGLLRVVERRPGKRRAEALYDLTASRVTVVGAHRHGAHPAAIRLTRSMLRQASRDAVAALHRGEEALTGRFYGAQLTAALRPSSLRRALRHLQAIENLLERENRRGGTDAELFRWTTIFAPLRRAPRGDS